MNVKKKTCAGILFAALVGVFTAYWVDVSPADAQCCCAKCIGSDPCTACKNCKYSVHCNEGGGTCGVCKKVAAEIE
jgi:hypothetical protein